MSFAKRGIVTSISSNKCIVITPQGTYERIPLPKQGAQIGAEISYSRIMIPTAAKPLLMVASLILVLACVWLQQTHIPQAAAYVSLDINPSMEISVDKNLQVIDVQYLNEDTARLLNNEKFKGQNLYDTLKKIIDKSIEKNYIKPGEDNLILTTVSPVDVNTATVDQQYVCQYIENYVSSQNRAGQVKIYSASQEIRTSAKKAGISSGKYLLYEQLHETGNNVKIDDIKKSTVKQLVENYHIELMPNYKKFTLQKQKNSRQPELDIDDDGKSVPLKQYIKSNNSNRKSDNSNVKQVINSHDKQINKNKPSPSNTRTQTNPSVKKNNHDNNNNRPIPKKQGNDSNNQSRFSKDKEDRDKKDRREN